MYKVNEQMATPPLVHASCACSAGVVCGQPGSSMLIGRICLEKLLTVASLVDSSPTEEGARGFLSVVWLMQWEKLDYRRLLVPGMLLVRS